MHDRVGPLQELPDDPHSPGRKLLRLPFSDVCGPITPPFLHPTTQKVMQGALVSRIDYYHQPDAVPYIQGPEGWVIRYDLFDDFNRFRCTLSQDWHYESLPLYLSMILPHGWSLHILQGHPHEYDTWLSIQYQAPSGEWLDMFDWGRYRPQYALDRKQLEAQNWGTYFINAYGSGTATPYNTRPPYDQYPHTVVCDWIYADCVFALITAPLKRSPGIISAIMPILLFGSMLMTSTKDPVVKMT